MSNQSLTIYQKFILLGFPAEDRVILKYQARHLRCGLSREKERCGQSANSTADNYAIVRLACIDDVFRKGIVKIVADAVPGPKNCQGVAVGGAVLAHTAISGKFIFFA